MAKVRIVEFEVVGVGEFPIDMLRYDACYPADGHSVEAMNHSLASGLFTSEKRLEQRRVRLHHRDVYAAWSPTDGRWSSFGWPVDRATVKEWAS